MQVEDNGPGIPEQLLAQVFEPYVSSKSKGSGLGLAIVKKIVEEHGGLVRVYNKTTGGACIDIQFPVDIAVQDEVLKTDDEVSDTEIDSPVGGR